jgi:hypothetical protein
MYHSMDASVMGDAKEASTGDKFKKVSKSTVNVGVIAAWTAVVGLAVAVVVIFLVMGSTILDVINSVADKVN